MIEWRLDKTKLSFFSLDDQPRESAFWLTKTPQERIEGIEIIRQNFYGYDPAISRLQRVLEVADLREG